MDIMILRLFQQEVKRQCEFALIANEDLKKALSNREMSMFWYSTQGFLVAVANVSKLLWGENDLSEKKRKILRESLDVPNKSVLRSRTLRNHFEHFDDRLEKWYKSSQTKVFVDSNIGTVVATDRSAYFRNFDPYTYTFTFKDQRYEIQPIVQAIFELWQKASVEAGKPPWNE